jgi:sulfite reductase (NADPH) hemoprotein beta-component
VKDHRGQWQFTLFVENGRVADRAERKMLSGLRAIAEVHKGDFRLTANQNVIIAGVAARQKKTIEKLLDAHDLAVSVSGLRRNAMACVALPTCGLALAESERYLPDMVPALDEVWRASAFRRTIS